MKNLFFLIACMVLFFFSGQDLYAKTVNLGYRAGMVTAAEFSSVSTEIVDTDKYPYGTLPKNPRYAVVVVKLEANRSISSLDYSLVINGVTAKCIAAALNMDPFVCSPATVYPAAADSVRLLFVFDGSKVPGPAAGKTVAAKLSSNLRSRSSVNINVSGLGNGKFTDTAKIPAAGLLK